MHELTDPLSHRCAVAARMYEYVADAGFADPCPILSRESQAQFQIETGKGAVSSPGGHGEQSCNAKYLMGINKQNLIHLQLN